MTKCKITDGFANGRYASIGNVFLLGTAVAALLAAPLAQAQPIVNGEEISWPDDGWYQVQTADGLTSICEGTRSCLVEPGRYIVINHTTGERFTNVLVSDAPIAEGVSVDGNTISWPDDGWYQVQSADGLSNICEGTRSCVVEPGQYIVINHTTNQRFTNILVQGEPNTEGVSVDGNTISWPDDGWYEVQLASTYMSVCQGGRSCTVDDGIYKVINHTTGERFKNITVNGESGGGEPPIVSALNLLDVSQDLIKTAAGYQLDKLAVVVDDLAFVVGQQTTIQWPDNSWYQVQNAQTNASVCNGGAECNILPGSYRVINHSTGERSLLEVPYISPDDQPGATQLPQTIETFSLRVYPDLLSTEMNIKRTHYNCENGGSLVLEKGNDNEGIFYDAFGSLVGGVSEKYGYEFDQCLMTLQNGLLPNGNYELHGNLQTNILFGYGDAQSNYIFDEFSIIGDNGVEYRAHGQTEDIDGYDFDYLRSATITEYHEKLPDVEINETITDVKFNYETLNNTTVVSAPWKTLDVNGIVRNAQTAGQEVTIKTSPVMTWGSDPFTPFNGSIEMQAEDGSFLYQNANPYVDPENFWALFADFDYTAANAERSQLYREIYSFPFEFGEQSCFHFRSDETGRLHCPDNYLD